MALQSLLGHLLRGIRLRDVAGNRQDIGVIGGLDRVRVRDNPIVAFSERPHQARANSLRCAGDDGNFLLRIRHNEPPAFCFSDGADADRRRDPDRWGRAARLRKPAVTCDSR